MSKDNLELQNETTFNRLRSFMNSDDGELAHKDKIILERWKFAYDQLQIEKKHHVALRLQKIYPISQSLAYKDINNARKLFNPLNRHDIEFERIWLVNMIKGDILTAQKIANIERRLRLTDRLYERYYKALGLDKDEIERIDPELLGGNTLVAQFNLNNTVINMNLDENRVIPKALKDELMTAMYEDISIEDAQILIDKGNDGDKDIVDK